MKKFLLIILWHLLFLAPFTNPGLCKHKNEFSSIITNKFKGNKGVEILSGFGTDFIIKRKNYFFFSKTILVLGPYQADIGIGMYNTVFIYNNKIKFNLLRKNVGIN